jgi:hypothetical protein
MGMTTKRTNRRSPFPPIAPTTTIVGLCNTDMLDELTHAELVVYLRLTALRGKYDTTEMPVRNSEIHKDARTAGRALSRLAARGMVSVRFSAADNARTVEVM